MKKCLISLALALMILLSFAACGPANLQNPNETEGSTAKTTEPEGTATETTEPEVTEPEVTEPEVTEPEVTEPEVTEPEVTEPEVTEPEVTEPEVTEPEVTEPEVTEPEVTEPEVTEPEVTEPEVTEPEVTEPEVTEPEVTEPEVTEPEVTEPEVTEPEVTEPEVTEPEVTEPEVTEPEVTEPEVTEPPVVKVPDEAALRKLVVDYMYEICTIPWTPSVDITFECDHTSHKQEYKAGVTYYGLPYTHHCGSLEKFKEYLEADGTMSEKYDVIKYWGNDCADAVFWAWSQVSSKISFTLTKEMMNANGVIPVGDYKFSSNNTSTICGVNGRTAMYKVYAQLQPGDAVLKYTSSGHVRMVAQPAHVVYDSNGNIDGNKSYIITHEQGASFSVSTKKTTCLANGKYTFAKLYSGDYVPMTIEAFSAGVEDEIRVSTSNTDQTKNGVGQGTITSNYRINSVRVRILDDAGNVVEEKYKYPPNVNTNNGTTYALSQLGVSLSGLTSGKEYTYEVLVGAGGEIEKVQTFRFKC